MCSCRQHSTLRMRVPVSRPLPVFDHMGPFLNKCSSTRGSLFFCGVTLQNTLNGICGSHPLYSPVVDLEFLINSCPLPYDLPHVQEFTWLHGQSSTQTYKIPIEVRVIDSLTVIPGNQLSHIRCDSSRLLCPLFSWQYLLLEHSPRFMLLRGSMDQLQEGLLSR